MFRVMPTPFSSRVGDCESSEPFRLLGSAVSLLRDGDAAALEGDSVWPELHATLSELGFGHWNYCAVPSGYTAANGVPVHVTAYPEGWVRGFEEHDFASFTSVVETALRGSDSVSYGVVRDSLPLTPRFRQLLDLNRSFGVSRGIMLPLRNVLGMDALLSLVFEGTTHELPTYWLEARHTVLEHAHAFNRALLGRHSPLFAARLAPVLTERQIAVVNALAQGHATLEIAEVLRVSVHTVDKHIALAKRALGAASSPHLVALALRWGLIA